MSIFEIYFILLLDRIYNLAVACQVISGVILVIWIVIRILQEDEGTSGEWSPSTIQIFQTWTPTVVKVLCSILLIGLLILTFLPTTDQMLVIIAGSYVTDPELIQTLSDEGREFYDLFKQYIEQQIEEPK